jgi:hypothetical protein
MAACAFTSRSPPTTATFELNRRRVILEAGSCWYLRLSDPHSVANRGDADRVHLVVDASVNEWVEAVFAAAARQ